MWQSLAALIFGLLLSVWAAYLPESQFVFFCTLLVVLIAIVSISSRPLLIQTPLITKCSCEGARSIIRRLVPVLWLLLLTLAGFEYGSWKGQKSYSRWLPLTVTQQSQVLTGTLVELPTVSNGRARLVVDGCLNDLPDPHCGLYSLSWHFLSYEQPLKDLSTHKQFSHKQSSEEKFPQNDPPELKAGQRWKLHVRLKRPHGFASPGAKDYEADLLRRRIIATGYVQEATTGNKFLGERAGFALNPLRETLSAWLTAYLPEEGRGVLKALLLGDTRELNDGEWLLFRSTGTIHLLVISGLHISLVALAGWFLARCLGWLGVLPLHRISLPKISALSGLLLAVAYSALAGAGLPVQRALIMLGVGVLCLLLGFRFPLRTVYLMALCGVLLVQPVAATATGFWLSFLAVAALLALFSNRRESSLKPFKINNLHGVVKAQLVVTIALAPVLAYQQQSVSLLSPLINLFSIPLVAGLVVPFALLGAALSVICLPVGLWVLHQLCMVLAYWQRGLEWCMSYGCVAGQLPVPGVLAMVCAGLGVVLLFSPGALGWRWLGVLGFIPWLLPTINPPEEGQVQIAVLDVGQGLAAVVRTRHHALVYDTGDRFTPTFTAAQAVLIPWLRVHSVVPDRVMISHSDRDHIGGLDVLREAYPNMHVEMPALPLDSNYCVEGKSWQWDGVSFLYLGHGGDAEASANDRSCVLQICIEQPANAPRGRECALLTGDITRRREVALVETYGDALHSRLLLAPHHGSDSSSSKVFLQAVAPEWVSVPAGFRNRFHHPSPKAMERYQQQRARIFITGLTGTQVFILGGVNENATSGTQPYRYRTTEGRWWQRGDTGSEYSSQEPAKCDPVPLWISRLNPGLW